jgi:hypothetical protein
MRGSVGSEAQKRTGRTPSRARVYGIEDARTFLAGEGLDVEALAKEVDGTFISGFIRASKPARQPWLVQPQVRTVGAIPSGRLSRIERVRRRRPAALGSEIGSPVVRSLSDELGECVELLLERGHPSELDVLLVSHLNQDGLHPRETLRDWLHNGGHDGLNASTTRVMSRHSGDCNC